MKFSMLNSMYIPNFRLFSLTQLYMYNFFALITAGLL